MTSWIDTLIIIVIVILGLFILYKPLKEPIDAIGRGIKRAFEWIGEKIRGREVPSYEVINYG